MVLLRGSLIAVLWQPAASRAPLALSSGEAELCAIGQGVSEGLFVRSLIQEAQGKRIEQRALIALRETKACWIEVSVCARFDC